jgi:hypothetical protein
MRAGEVTGTPAALRILPADHYLRHIGRVQVCAAACHAARAGRRARASPDRLLTDIAGNTIAGLMDQFLAQLEESDAEDVETFADALGRFFDC